MFLEADTSFIRWATETSFLPAREKERMLLILTAGYIELLANCLAKERNLPEFKSLHQAIEKLRDLDLIDTELHELLHWLRDLRNRAAHEPFFRLQPEDVKHLPSYWSDPQYLEHACKGICGSLWNRHAATFDKVFGNLPRA
ncbi:hypothetical protein CSC70_13145 [Pseudoxanthomonas kalamensis DSM 18571]|uniref:DUF4145 domain-containing protein n=1 Tax=Pseudoxanthomonas kalamensis TaxID=289483 RepID=UPI001390B44E|nr:DUF4145 domain-containing protein [Pseudoxanthomonas kalamensis]KAF1708304.1 hypothetical protein CSC70_13145 [Pseudoxanthomonas kalamensis DSM 18571]